MNRTLYKRLLLIVGVLLLNACASSEVYDLGFGKSIGSIGSKTTVVIEDKRPASDKEYSMGSLLFTSDEYGIHTLGDNSLNRQ